MDLREGVDFKVRCHPRGNGRILVAAPHGGCIEEGTTGIGRVLAEIGRFSWYSYDGLNPEQGEKLFIPSRDFFESGFIQMASKAQYVVAIQGAARAGIEIFIGGRSRKLKRYAEVALTSLGCPYKIHSEGPFAGTNPSEICNRGTSEEGLQLEIPCQLRAILKDPLSRRRFAEELAAGIIAATPR